MGRLNTQVEEENAHRCQLITEQSRLSVEMTIGIRWRSGEASRDPLKMRAAPFVRIRRTFCGSMVRMNLDVTAPIVDTLLPAQNCYLTSPQCYRAESPDSSATSSVRIGQTSRATVAGALGVGIPT